jgi:CheY-specific phosphatase CheX
MEPPDVFSVDDGDLVSTEVHFQGHRGGTLRIEFSKGLAALIADSFLGGNPSEMTDEQYRDGLLEITNMIGGNFLQRVDPEGRLVLSLPSLCLSSHALGMGKPQLAMDVEGHILRVFVEEPREEAPS